MAEPPGSSPDSSRPRPSHDYDAAYATATPPWDIGRPQQAFAHLGETGALVGNVLDVGCGTGEHALLAASLGHRAFGVDISTAAIELAQAKAAERGLEARFLVLDAFRLVDLGEQFDTVLDCGFFHTLDDEERTRFVHALTRAVPPEGRFHMLCFSDREPGDWGPRRVTENEIRASFAEGWILDSIGETVLDLTIDPAQVAAWQVVAIRRPSAGAT